MSLPQRAEVIVVGGGIFGCATALHLLERGVEDVLVLERDGLAQATSHAGGGFVGRWGGGYVPAWGSRSSCSRPTPSTSTASLAEDHGLEFGYKRNGSLWAATTPETWDAHLEVIATHAEVENKQTLSAAEVEEVTGGVILASGRRRRRAASRRLPGAGAARDDRDRPVSSRRPAGRSARAPRSPAGGRGRAHPGRRDARGHDRGRQRRRRRGRVDERPATPASAHGCRWCR